ACPPSDRPSLTEYQDLRQTNALIAVGAYQSRISNFCQSSAKAYRHLPQSNHGGGEMDEARETDGTALVPGREAAEVFEASEASFNLIAMLVDGSVVRDEYLAIALGTDHRRGIHRGYVLSPAMCSRKSLPS
ncbi:hypothetical protein, partial [Novosphingobium resinovorum]|uniref:hypothetical protein n=1 Tax=Novosphingobium resinovorum TaxID=158500 RepID=UPI002ED0B099